LASASNVFVFQLFAALPADILSYGAIVILGVVAGLSGVVFAGFLAHILLAALRRAGVVKDRPPQPMGRRAYPIFLASAVLLTAALTGYLFTTQRGAATVAIGGAVTAPYAYPETHGDLPAITAASALRGVTTRYTGVPVRDLLTPAEPAADADLLLVQAADGYAFFISMTEVQTSTGLLLASRDAGRTLPTTSWAREQQGVGARRDGVDRHRPRHAGHGGRVGATDPLQSRGLAICDG
jgi:hypothetical protein